MDSSDRRDPRPERGHVARTSPHPTLDLYSDQVEAMMNRGMSFDDVEDLINVAPLNLDEKGALWLLAWSLETPDVQGVRARATLAMVRADDEASPIDDRSALCDGPSAEPAGAMNDRNGHRARWRPARIARR
jgi:hypothetical protein